MISDLADTTLLAKNFTFGRKDKPRVIVLHTTENSTAPGVARNVATWFAGKGHAPPPEASAHYIVGPEEILGCVDEQDTAWHAPPANPYGIGIEMVARAAYTAEDWARPEVEEMLERATMLVADICGRWAIPVAFLDEEALRRGDAGITTHAAVSRAFGKSTHWDPGAGFNVEAFLVRVQDQLDARATDPADPPEALPPSPVQTSPAPA